MNILIVKESGPETYSVSRLKRDNPNTSFPQELAPEMLAAYAVYPYTDTPPPSNFDPTKQTISQGGFYKRRGQWFRDWEVRTLTQDEVRAGMVCTKKQGRLALGRVEIDRLDAFIDSFPNSWALREVVDNSVNWRRTSQDMVMLGFALGYDDNEMDDAFIRAMAIEA